MPNTGLEVESGYVAGASQALEDACAGNVAPHCHEGVRFCSLPGMQGYRRLILRMSCRSVLTVAASTSPRRSMNSLVRRSTSS